MHGCVRMTAVGAAMIALAGCESYTQTTSGAAYLAKYEAPSAVAAADDTLTKDVRTVAAIEPRLGGRIELSAAAGWPGVSGVSTTR